MASRSQRKKELHKKKRQAKKQHAQARRPNSPRKVEVAVGSNVRHRQRLAQQTPKAWSGEPPEDVAVFDDSVLETLPSDLVPQVAAIRQALQNATELRAADALNGVSTIPRSSPLSQWRLFIRGLVGWLADDIETAVEAWKRLDFQRRPGRIAIAMMTSLQTGLDQPLQPDANESEETEGSNDRSPQRWRSRCDDQLLYHAKLLRRIRFDRSAIHIAEAGLRLPEESKKLLLGPRRLRWVKEFVAEYRDIEPDLTVALSQVALGRAFAQSYGNIFDEAAREFEGPRHDRRNLLLSFFYFMRFENDRTAEMRAERALDEYLANDLPRNEALSPSLRGAIASCIHLNEAIEFMDMNDGMQWGQLFAAPTDPRPIQKHLNASVKAYPAHRAAHIAHAEWIESQLDNRRLTKPKRKPLEAKLSRVMLAWSQALPDDARPRLWLVDYLLENEQTEAARPHIEWLAASRQDDPRVRAAPWKWELLEARRLCRRAAWLADAPARLDEAERIWPAWLSKQWLPYFRAAWALRAGRVEEYEQQRRQIGEENGLARDTLADACMMLGAAQLMQVPAAGLKPLRIPVDTAVENLGQLPLDELLAAAGFFWDMHRVQLKYPAYQRHGSRIGKELVSRLSRSPQIVRDRIDDAVIHHAVLWCSENRFWEDVFELKSTPWHSTPAVLQHPVFAAARLNSFFKLRVPWGFEPYREIGPVLREAAESQRDVYYRHWFASMADELDEMLSRETASHSFMANLFGRDNDGDEDENETDLDDVPNRGRPDGEAAGRAVEETP